MEKQIHNMLKKDPSLISYCYKFLNIISRANLLFQAHTIHLPLLQKAPAGLLKNATNKNRKFIFVLKMFLLRIEVKKTTS